MANWCIRLIDFANQGFAFIGKVLAVARVVLAMSGGVDSSVAAHLLRRAGHDVVGLFMRHGETLETCSTSNGSATAAPADSCFEVGSQAGLLQLRRMLPMHAAWPISSASRSTRLIFPRLLAGSSTISWQNIGPRTPNPCVMCNNWLKFGKLFDYADSVGEQFVATGHYARLTQDRGELALRRGLDVGKDQSYVLFGVERKLLPRMMLPVGEFRKSEIRGDGPRDGHAGRRQKR